MLVDGIMLLGIKLNTACGRAKFVNGEVQLQALVDGKKIVITESIVRRDLQLEDVEGVDCLPNATIFEQLTSMGLKSLGGQKKDTKVPQPSGPTTNVADKAINEEMDDSLVRAAITSSSLKAEKDSGGGPRRQETIGDTISQTRSENVSKHSNDPLLTRGNTLRSGDDRQKLEDLMALCTTLQSRVLALETTKTTQATGIASLKRRVKKLERRNKLRTHRLKRLYRVGSSRRTGEDMFGVNDLDGDEVIVESIDVVKTAKETRSVVEEVTAVTIPVKLKSAKPKAEKVVIQEPEQGTTTPTLATTTAATTIIAVNTRPRAKGLVIHEYEQAPTPTVCSQQPSQLKKKKKKKKKEEEEEERLAREKGQQVEEANIAWDDVQAKINADYQLAQRLQAQEQEELTDEEKARLFVNFLEQRRKHFTAKRAEENRNRPPTRAQQRSIMSMIMVNTFVDYKTELVKESSKKAEVEIAHERSLKRAGEELEQETSKKQKLEEDKESEELKQCLDIILDDRDDVTFDATPLSTKSPTIMLKNFDREDLEVLWSIVKARFKKTKPVNYMDNFLLLILKTMFEHHVEDNVWKKKQGLVKVLNCKLYDSCGVHCVIMKNMLFYLLVEKIYPLTNHTLHQMFNEVKLQVDYECEMAFELLRLVKKQLKEGYVPE
ncbi:hypothetical protein Tco_1154477 [Tanacetum coccineum]